MFVVFFSRLPCLPRPIEDGNSAESILTWFLAHQRAHSSEWTVRANELKHSLEQIHNKHINKENEMLEAMFGPKK